MGLDFIEEDVAILNVLSSGKRLKTFFYLSEGRPAQEIADEFGVSRNAVQHYISDFKDVGLLETVGREYRLTEKGERVVELLNDLDDVVREARIRQIRESAEGLSEEEIQNALRDEE